MKFRRFHVFLKSIEINHPLRKRSYSIMFLVELGIPQPLVVAWTGSSFITNKYSYLKHARSSCLSSVFHDILNRGLKTSSVIASIFEAIDESVSHSANSLLRGCLSTVISYSIFNNV